MALPSARKASIPNGSPLAYRRIVVKAGTNVLTHKSPRLDKGVLASLAAQVAAVQSLGAQVVLVSSGAVAAGREVMGVPHAAKGVALSQMLAAVGQGRLMHAYQEAFAAHGLVVAQALLTRTDVEDRLGYLNIRNTLDGLLAHGVVPIVNENDVVDTAELGEARFGDNDTLSALVANLVDAGLLLLLTDTDGLYTADPNRDPKATLIERVERVDAGVLALAEEHRSKFSRGGMLSKLLAAQRATAAGVTVVIGPGASDDVVRRAACAEPVGTLFPTRVSALESRKRWLLSGVADSGGVLVLDEGAVLAVRERDGSLLPAGIRSVRGEFARGAVVTLEDGTGTRVGFGITNYTAGDLRAIAGARSSQIAERLGHDYGDEAVHRNNLVLV
ncbi:MAG: glutamate 5-kinase [Chloroflexota bacterium]